MARNIDQPAVHLWLILWKAYEAVQATAERSIESLGMCLTDFGVLEMVLHKGPLPVNAIGARLGLTSGSITTAIDRLEARALVERRDHTEDRRAKVVHLTVEGKRLITKSFAEHEAHLEEVVSTSISMRERRVLGDLLKKLGKGAEESLARAQNRAGSDSPKAKRDERGEPSPKHARRTYGNRN